MNGDWKDRPLEQWFEEELPRCADQWPVHCRFLLKDPEQGESLVRAFASSLRLDWWHSLLRRSPHLVAENRRLEAENDKLKDQNRNLRKRARQRL